MKYRECDFFKESREGAEIWAISTLGSSIAASRRRRSFKPRYAIVVILVHFLAETRVPTRKPLGIFTCAVVKLAKFPPGI